MMKHNFFLFLVLCMSAHAQAQIITTWAGNGYRGNFNNPTGACFDKQGNFYVADQLGNQVFKIDTACINSVVAGTGYPGYNGDSILSNNARLKQPVSVITDSIGNIFIADGVNCRIRKIDYYTGIITTIAGNGTCGYNGDSILAINAQLHYPNNICFDRLGNLYIADWGNTRIRKVDKFGIIHTIIGTGGNNSTVNGGLADTTSIGSPVGLACDTFNNIYISDGSFYKIYKYNYITHLINVFAGTDSGYLYNGDNIPATSAQISPNKLNCNLDNNLYFVDTQPNNRIRMVDSAGIIHTVAGNGSAAYTGDYHNADSAGVGYPGGLAFDNCGNLYISTNNGIRGIRKVALNPACIDTPCAQHLNVSNSIIAASNTISIYPNPTENQIFISNAPIGTTIKVYSVVGRLLYTAIIKYNKENINTTTWPQGNYFIEFLYLDGSRELRKVVKY